MKPVDLKGPLTEFQACTFEKAEIKRLIISMNDSCEAKVNSTVIDKSFEAFWPELEKRVSETQKQFGNKTVKKERTSNDMLEEILMRIRAIGINGMGLGMSEINSRVLNDLNTMYNDAVDAFNKRDLFSLGSVLEQLYMPISFIGEKANFNINKPQVNRNIELDNIAKKGN